MLDNLLTWKRKFDAHSFDFTFLFNLEKNQGWRESMTNTLFTPSEALSFHQLEGGSNPRISNNDTYSTGNALMARINYSFMNRYLLTVSWRRDGYSAFGQENPYATFPAVHLPGSYQMKTFLTLIGSMNSSLGHRGVLMETGILESMMHLAQLATTQYQFGTTVATGIFSATMANSQLRWERTEAFNVGLDLGLLDDRIQATFDYYDMKTNDLLLNRSLPSIIGYTNVISNLGELANKGYEMSVSSVNIKNNGRFGWRSNVVFSFNRNKINNLYGEMVDILDEDGNVIGQKEADDPSNGWFIGQSIDRIWGFNVLGIWQLDESELAAQFGQLPGDPRIQDANDDGKLTVEDRVFLEYRRPRYRFGFRNDFTIMKNIEVAVFIRADLGHYSANGLYKPGMQPHRLNDYSVPYWTSENPTNKYTRLEALSPVPYSIYGSRGFIRLQDISISYIFPENLLERIPVRNLKMYVSSRNLLTFTNWTNWDPESGSSPMPKFYTFGLNITL
jgi:TonB-dependent starch-binding outer membrane protein SusC